MILNDQGGGVMSVSEDVVATLRAQDHGHPPRVYDAQRRHNYEEIGDVCVSLEAFWGTGGGNVPIVLESNQNHGHPPPVMENRREHMSRTSCYAIDHVVTGGGNCTAQGKCWYEEVRPTLKSGGVHAVCYGFDWQEERSIGGNSWYMEETAKTITATKPGAVLISDAKLK